MLVLYNPVTPLLVNTRVNNKEILLSGPALENFKRGKPASHYTPFIEYVKCKGMYKERDPSTVHAVRPNIAGLNLFSREIADCPLGCPLIFMPESFQSNKQSLIEPWNILPYNTITKHKQNMVVTKACFISILIPFILAKMSCQDCS
jgi:hypothetical protein